MKINADGNVDRETWPKTDLLGLPTYILERGEEELERKPYVQYSNSSKQ